MKIVFLIFIINLTCLGCNKIRRTAVGDLSYHSLYDDSHPEASVVIGLDKKDIGYEAASINEKIEQPIQKIELVFSENRQLDIRVTDSDPSGGKLSTIFDYDEDECGVYSDKFGKVKIEKIDEEYTVSFGELGGESRYILGRFDARPPIDCLK